MNNKYSVSKEIFFNELSKLLSVEDIRIATILSKISSAISSTRIKRKMNQKELSTFLNISQSMVSKLESGDYNFTIESMVKVLTALDIDFEVLIENTASEYFQDNEQDWYVTIKKEPFIFFNKNNQLLTEPKMSTKHIAHFQFAGSSISKIDFTNTLIHLPQELKRSIDVDYHIDDIKQDNKATIGLITLVVDMRLKPKKNTKGKTSINLHLQGCFSSDANVDIEEFKEFLLINGTSLLYTIARSIIQSLTSQAFLNDSVAVPMISLYYQYWEKKKQLKVEQ